MSTLFSPFQLRELVFKNRIFVSPMCQYSCTDGLANDWHLVHLGSRAVGGAALVMVEASAVTPAGRISPQDMGIWSDAHTAALAPIADFIKTNGAVPAIQLAHAGRKASTPAPWLGSAALSPEQGGWPVLAPSALAFSDASPHPAALDRAQIEQLVADFVAAAQRSLEAGFEVIELHFAHGYLLHEFLSPLSNSRTDDYGGSLENRARFPLEVARAVRAAWPQTLPVFVRLSTTDWAEGGWDLAQSIQLSHWLKAIGIDLIDCSSGGLVPHARIPVAPGFQTPNATAIRSAVEMPVGAVGLITSPAQAEQIVATGLADVVLLARELLRDPYWPLHAAQVLGDTVDWPQQYERAQPPRRK